MTVSIQMKGDVLDVTQVQLEAYGKELLGMCLSKKLGLVALTGDTKYEEAEFELETLTFSHTDGSGRRHGSYNYGGIGACRHCCSTCRRRDRRQLPESVQRDLLASAQGFANQMNTCMKNGFCKMNSKNPTCTMSVDIVAYEM